MLLIIIIRAFHCRYTIGARKDADSTRGEVPEAALRLCLEKDRIRYLIWPLDIIGLGEHQPCRAFLMRIIDQALACAEVEPILPLP